jgi:hypothetical protein
MSLSGRPVRDGVAEGLHNESAQAVPTEITKRHVGPQFILFVFKLGRPVPGFPRNATVVMAERSYPGLKSFAQVVRKRLRLGSHPMDD